jgi:hypothetical protein
MQENDRDHQMDDEPTHRAEGTQTRTAQAPAVRLLANPRRVRRT